MKTTELIELQKAITQGEWILKNCQRTGMALIEGPKGEDIAIADEGFPQHNAVAISLVPSLLREVLELREALGKTAWALEWHIERGCAVATDFHIAKNARSLLTRHETTNR